MKIFLSIMVCFISLYSECDIKKGIEIPASKATNISYITSKIDADFTQSDLRSLKSDIEDCNQNISSSINSIKSSIKTQYNFYQSISNNKDINEIEKQISKKREAIKDAKVIMQNSLKSIGFSGIFAVTLNDINIYGGKKSFEKKSESIITPKAVENLSGVYLESITTLDNQTVTDMIRQKIAGKVIVENIYLTKMDRASKKFFYLARVKVLPLEKQLTSGAKGSTIEAFEIQPSFNLDKIPTKYKKDVKNILNKFYSNVKNANDSSKESQENTLDAYEETVQDNNIEIKKLKRKLTKTKKKLKRIYSNINYNCKSTNSICNKKAQEKIVSKVKKLKKDILYTKDGELIYKSSYVETEGDDPREDIANATKAVINQIKQTYSKVESYSQDTVVVNNAIVKDTSGKKKEIYRDLEKFYLYPVPTEGNGFNYAVVAKFLTSKTNDDESYTPPKPKEQKTKATFSLTIETTPSNAKVYITNIQPKYYDSIKLKKGNYKIKVTKKGYKTFLGYVDHDSDKTYTVALEKNKQKPKATQSVKISTKNSQGWDKSIYSGKRSYSKNSSNTVKDNLTGLVWQKSDDGVKRDYNDAKRYCSNLSLDGSSNWRLPTYNELYYLADRLKGKSPAIDTNYFKVKRGYWYWTTTKTKWDSSKAWVVLFNDGNGSYFGISNAYYVRCVR